MSANTQDIQFESLDTFKLPSLRLSTLGVLGIVFVFGVITLLFLPVLHVGDGSLFVTVIVICMVAAATVAIMKNNAIKRRNEDALRAFAAANGMSYLAGSKEIDTVGSLFGIGDTRSRGHILAGSLEGLPFMSYEYFYYTGSGKNRTQHDAMVVEFTLPRVLPQFVIDSQLEDVIPVSFDKSQKIELEGDFHKYFDLYAPDTYGVSALTLLAPDTMEVLMEHAALCDIEVVQNKLFFYWPVPAGSRGQYEKLFGTARAVLQKLGSKLTKDDIYGTQSQAQIHAQPNSQGVRLKQSKIGLFVVGIFILYIVMQFVRGTHFAPLGGLFMGLFWVGIVGWAVFASIKQTRLKQEYLQRYQSKKL